MNIVQAIKSIEVIAPKQLGIFSISDLNNLLHPTARLSLMRILKRLTQLGTLTKIQRGIYVTAQFDLWVLSKRLFPNGYISMDSVLARNGLIGTVPDQSLSIVDTRRGRTIQTPRGIIRCFSIQPDLRFGFNIEKWGVTVANSEKSFLDLLYFYTKGQRFAIDPVNEVDISKLDIKKVMQYLTFYKNPKFIQFVKGVCREKS